MLDISWELKVKETPLTQGKGGDVMAEELVKAMEFGVNLATHEILPLTPVDRGNLRGGTQSRVLGEGADLLGRVFNPLAHALPMEAGAKPHFPPVKPLEGWVRRKLGITKRGEVRSVAFAIARAISKRGTAPRAFFRRGWTSAKPRVMRRFGEAMATARKRLAGER